MDAYGSDSETRCFTIVVKKCQYCLQPGESINSIAMSLGTDWLQLYTMNPFLGTPDDLAPYTRVNTGVFYDVRKVLALKPMSRGETLADACFFPSTSGANSVITPHDDQIACMDA
jgi:hypothetical protein